MRDVANYASCISAISLPIYKQIQIGFLYRNNRANFIHTLKLYTAHMRCSRENAIIQRQINLINTRPQKANDAASILAKPLYWSFTQCLHDADWFLISITLCSVSKTDVGELPSIEFGGLSKPNISSLLFHS